MKSKAAMKIELDLEAAEIRFAGRAFPFPRLPGQVRAIVEAGGIIAYIKGQT